VVLNAQASDGKEAQDEGAKNICYVEVGSHLVCFQKKIDRKSYPLRHEC